MIDEPEEDKHLKQNRRDIEQKLHKHEWVDMYQGGGFRKGQLDRALQAFFCKWCLRIRVIEWDQSAYNTNFPEDELNDPV